MILVTFQHSADFNAFIKWFDVTFPNKSLVIHPVRENWAVSFKP